ncbi:MAG: hypothetical protein AUJ92_12270 [Armatimonadetes bacterium CG2_30_59_28]|nr:MAG: hypothetical protein AUJ92_12270 [Armatimonadetes bacterium CG2_30_59_28]PIU60337.1 MAG: hypothetical protein COS85_24940 [Armatimonadetes bacterium CG07_land_8_20_14_0_80_59_28]PIX38362.1 MAG: hypothetical protein COZ56_20715 [Armatimonadetes bacterium CG_4_8_14_3_um_filter_58_9]PIY43720.1 MAG: hypothetical protein COZ05_10240 [Armatimonadetes bacterium CG_4_10_14_3_um_filter_59_10]
MEAVAATASGYDLVKDYFARVLSHEGLDPSDDIVKETGAIDVFFADSQSPKSYGQGAVLRHFLVPSNRDGTAARVS